MPGKHLYEYAVVRVVPQVEREEFMNVGVLLYSRSMRYLSMAYALETDRLLAFAPQLDIPTVQQYLRAMQAVCSGDAAGGAIGALDAPSRFRWLTATRSTIVQCSKVHPGLCDGTPQQHLDALFTKLVLPRVAESPVDKKIPSL